MKKVTCGVLVFVKDKILLGHSTNNDFWDIPKGIKEVDEDYASAAIRESFEETGLVVQPDQLIDIGLFKFNKEKDIYLFAIYLDSINISDLYCDSMVQAPVPFPEVDDFKLFDTDTVIPYLSKSMQKLMIEQNIIDKYKNT